MDMVPWNPLRDMMKLRNEIDELFVRTLGMSPEDWQENENWDLALDVAEHEESLVVQASVPGVNPDDLDIIISDNMLTIKGERKTDKSIDEGQYKIRERHYGSFARTINLPLPVNADAVDAAYENGVLTLTIQKAEDAKPHRIAVKPLGNGL